MSIFLYLWADLAFCAGFPAQQSSAVSPELAGGGCSFSLTGPPAAGSSPAPQHSASVRPPAVQTDHTGKHKLSHGIRGLICYISEVIVLGVWSKGKMLRVEILKMTAFWDFFPKQFTSLANIMYTRTDSQTLLQKIGIQNNIPNCFKWFVKVPLVIF